MNQPAAPEPNSSERTVWKGTTWPLGPISVLTCSQQKWHITNASIELTAGCCGSTIDNMELRRINDIQFKRSCFQLLACNRGTIVLFSSDTTTPKVEISVFGAKSLYHNLMEAWKGARKDITVVDG